MKGLEGKVHYQRSEFLGARVVMVGEAALLTYNYRSSVLSEQGVVLSQSSWNTTEVFFWREGAWKTVHTHWSFVKHRLPEFIEFPVSLHSTETNYDGVLG